MSHIECVNVSSARPFRVSEMPKLSLSSPFMSAEIAHKGGHQCSTHVCNLFSMLIITPSCVNIVCFSHRCPLFTAVFMLSVFRSYIHSLAPARAHMHEHMKVCTCTNLHRYAHAYMFVHTTAAHARVNANTHTRRVKSVLFSPRNTPPLCRGGGGGQRAFMHIHHSPPRVTSTGRYIAVLRLGFSTLRRHKVH